jgi:methionyl-tRNA formyltransferase
MNTDIKALVLCNNAIALPGIREFLFYGKVGAIAVTRRNKEMQQVFSQLLKDTEVPLLIVTRKNYEEVLTDAIGRYNINVGLMMTFPFVLPEAIWKLPQKGFINFHYGLLPQCRGPQPVLRHLLNNDAEAGVTLHKVDGGIDTGDIIMQEKLTIATGDTYGALQTKLAWLAAKPAANLLKILSYGSIVPAKPQDESLANYYEMPGAAELTINWKEMDASRIVRLVNACNPWNKGAGSSIGEWVMGITEVEIEENRQPPVEMEPGTIFACNKEEGLLVKTCNSKTLKINIIYLQEGFYSGHRLSEFDVTVGQTFGK